jgi:hypothetical protein
MHKRFVVAVAAEYDGRMRTRASELRGEVRREWRLAGPANGEIPNAERRNRRRSRRENA